jgi:two-component system, cell cycle sensor histidine kinase and response regulator CckA
MNLITNASDALGEDTGRIGLRTGLMTIDRPGGYTLYAATDLPSGEYLFLEVADTGCGMDEATQARIFDPFFTTKFTGRGLGLAAVLGIVRAHKGAIRVESTPGRGSRFQVLLPAAPRTPVPEPDHTPAPVRWKGEGTVLVVEDEDSVRTLARFILERAGFKVLVAEDGQVGIEAFDRDGDEVALVLLDLTMPRLSGQEVFAELRRRRPDLRVVLMSGYSEEDLRDRFARMGAVGFLPKPFGPNDLILAVRRALEQGAES